MGRWHGKGQDENPNERPKLPEGEHIVTLASWKQLDSGDYLAFFEDSKGREVSYWIPDDIEPPREDASEKERKANKSWIFFRLAGAGDWPSEEYWAAPPEERPEIAWESETVLGAITRSQKEIGVEVRKSKDGKYHNVRAMWSPRRDPREAETRTVPHEQDVPF